MGVIEVLRNTGANVRAAGAALAKDVDTAGAVSLLERLQYVTHIAPEALAVVDSRGGCIKRQELLDEARQVAALYSEIDIKAGEAVVMALPDTVDWEIAFVACLLLRAVPATLPMSLDVSSITHACRLVGARLLVLEASGSLDAAHAAGSEIVSRLEGRIAVLSKSGDVWRLSKPRASTPLVRPSNLDGIDHVMFTSSTTGLPKAVGHADRSLAAVNRGFAERFSLGPQTPIFMASPLGHSVGAWHGVRLSLFLGAPLVLQERWDPDQALGIIREHGCAFTAAATPFLQDLTTAAVHQDVRDLPLRAFLCGGAPVPPSLLVRARDALPDTFVTVLWGMTEGGVTTCRPGDAFDMVTGSAGLGLPGLELVALASDGTPLGPNGEGEIGMRGPGVFETYVGQPELYAESVTPDGWFRTGDLGIVDEEGYLYLRGRIKDLIIRGGVNISPIPIEEALVAHPKVRQVAVVGYPDERLGERIGAIVVPIGEQPTFDELIDWAAANGLPKRWLPERLWLVEAVPMTPAGKIRKADLRVWLQDELSNSTETLG